MQTPIVATQISTNKDTLPNSPSGICIFTKYKLGEKTIGQNTPIYKNRGCSLKFVDYEICVA